MRSAFIFTLVVSLLACAPATESDEEVVEGDGNAFTGTETDDGFVDPKGSVCVYKQGAEHFCLRSQTFPNTGTYEGRTWTILADPYSNIPTLLRRLKNGQDEQLDPKVWAVYKKVTPAVVKHNQDVFVALRNNPLLQNFESKLAQFVGASALVGAGVGAAMIVLGASGSVVGGASVLEGSVSSSAATATLEEILAAPLQVAGAGGGVQATVTTAAGPTTVKIFTQGASMYGPAGSIVTLAYKLPSGLWTKVVFAVEGGAIRTIEGSLAAVGL